MVRLSPTSGLNLFQECPRCFWLHFNKRVQRPRGIFPSLPGGMDLVIKKYFDQHQGELPPEIDGSVEGILMQDLNLLNKWRNWRTGLRYLDKELDAELFGALDDCLVDGEHYIPLDFKTRGSGPKEGDSEKYYQTQLDSYSLLLNENGYTTKDFGYLIYYFPLDVGEDEVVTFNTQVLKVGTDPNRARNVFVDAVKLLHDPIPNKNSDCEYCQWISDRLSYES